MVYLDCRRKVDVKMKRIYLKKWITNLILFIQMFLFIMLGSDCESTSLFITSKIVILLIMYMNHLIIKNYTRLYEEGEE